MSDNDFLDDLLSDNEDMLLPLPRGLQNNSQKDNVRGQREVNGNVCRGSNKRVQENGGDDFKPFVLNKNVDRENVSSGGISDEEDLPVLRSVDSGDVLPGVGLLDGDDLPDVGVLSGEFLSGSGAGAEDVVFGLEDKPSKLGSLDGSVFGVGDSLTTLGSFGVTDVTVSSDGFLDNYSKGVGEGSVGGSYSVDGDDRGLFEDEFVKGSLSVGEGSVGGKKRGKMVKAKGSKGGSVSGVSGVVRNNYAGRVETFRDDSLGVGFGGASEFSTGNDVVVDKGLSVSGSSVGGGVSSLTGGGVYSGSKDFGVNDSRSGRGKRMSRRELEFFLESSNFGFEGYDERVRVLNEFLGEAFGSGSVYRYGQGSIKAKDYDVLLFLSMFRIVKAYHIQRILGYKVLGSAVKRLGKLESFGLVRSVVAPGFGKIWLLTSLGASFVGNGLPVVTDSRFSPTTYNHSLVLSYVASNLWAGDLNVLALSDFPSKNRWDSDSGQWVLGETLVSENMLSSSYSKLTIGKTSDVARPIVQDAIDSLFGEWYANGMRGTPPEFVEGNEFLFYLLPPSGGGSAHPPDLVVKRERGADRAPACIAVEVELNNKPTGGTYEDTMRTYMNDTRIFDKVVWIARNKTIHNSLVRAIDTLGVEARRKIKVIPIYTESGTVTDNVWSL